MADPADAPTYKRKRVAKACETCRSMKAQCDGALPSCGRCSGYGYDCVYSSASWHKTRIAEGGQPAVLPVLQQQHKQQQHQLDSPLAREVERLRSAVADHDALLRGAATWLSEQEQGRVLGRLPTAPKPADGTVSRRNSPHASSPALQVVVIPLSSRSSSSPGDSPQRYLGEVSDVRLFSLVERVLQKNNLLAAAAHGDEGLSNYRLNNAAAKNPVALDGDDDNDVLVQLPNPDVAAQYLDAYFSTVHLAYPFMQKSSFMATYDRIRECGSVMNVDRSWIALLHILFAIGAYYTSFHGKDACNLHEQYFQRAISLSNAESHDRSINQVSFLLAECIYLLAVCRTDRCWLNLGLAVRVAQSLGLHTEIEAHEVRNGRDLRQIEIRRRLWYSLYVLDRLLARQLGRPPAIHDEDFHVALPSSLGDRDIQWDKDDAPLRASSDVPSTGDYFLSVIALSKIIGQVLRDAYGPSRDTLSTAEMSSITRSLDAKLLDWKGSLPRTLRFDFGHAFQTSLAYKRQRNMLAVKFHHLRALLYRPYLCLRLLRHHSGSTPPSILQGSYNQFGKYERICVAEAAETAHLIRNMASQKALVHDFPWWQMISCLICASSILLVASLFTRRVDGVVDGEFDVDTLQDDSETCLKVFEALSANSDGARIARDMMTRLNEHGHKWRQVEPDLKLQDAEEGLAGAPLAGALLPRSDAVPADHFEMGTEGIAPLFGEQDWPSEILDSMTWSAQFFDAAHGSPTSW